MNPVTEPWPRTTRLGKYRIIEKIGEGAMGEVWKAVDDGPLGREVALKLSKVSLGADWLQEAHALARMPAHSGVATLYDAFESEGACVLIMELARGRTLALRLRDAAQGLDWAELGPLFLGILEGLAHAHRHGVVHRDLKPANIMVGPDGSAKILDFGLARVHADPLAAFTRTTAGTALYKSPEQWLGNPQGPWSDVYSLGIVLYEMITGRVPFGAGGVSNGSLGQGHCFLPAPPPSLARDGVPAGLDRLLVAGMLAKDPGARPTLEAVGERLVCLLPGRTQPSAADVPRVSPYRAARVFQPGQKTFPDLHSSTYMHPGDETALGALKGAAGIEPILRFIHKHWTDQQILMQYGQTAVRVTERNFRSLYQLVLRCCEVLSCPMPEVFVQTDPFLNAMAAGTDRTFLILHSSLLEALDADELCFVIGHELGHIKAQHAFYRTLGRFLIPYWDQLVANIPVPGFSLARIPLLVLYHAWYRHSELTCDRAGLLCCQDPETAFRALSKLAGYVPGFAHEVDSEELDRQADIHQEVTNKLVVAQFMIDTWDRTHPFIPERIRALKAWVQDGSYGRILGGAYHRDPEALFSYGPRKVCACCSKAISPFARFCPHCGDASIASGPPPAPTRALACASCGSEFELGARFCGNCGAPCA